MRQVADERAYCRDAAATNGVGALWDSASVTHTDAWTMQRHLDAADESAQALFHRFKLLVETLGPVRWTVSKTAIVAKGSRRGFTGVVLKRAALGGYFDLQRTLPELGSDPRLRSASGTHPGCSYINSASLPPNSSTPPSRVGSPKLSRWATVLICPGQRRSGRSGRRRVERYRALMPRSVSRGVHGSAAPSATCREPSSYRPLYLTAFPLN